MSQQIHLSAFSVRDGAAESFRAYMRLKPLSCPERSGVNVLRRNGSRLALVLKDTPSDIVPLWYIALSVSVIDAGSFIPLYPKGANGGTAAFICGRYLRSNTDCGGHYQNYWLPSAQMAMPTLGFSVDRDDFS